MPGSKEPCRTEPASSPGPTRGVCAAFDLRLRVDAEHGGYPDDAMPPPVPADEAVEYGGLIADFVTAARTGRFDRDEIEEALETHRELLRARRAAGGTPSGTDSIRPPAS